MANAGAQTTQKSDANLELFLRYFPFVAASCAMLAVFLIDFGPICEAAAKLAARADSVTTVKALGVELTINERSVVDSVSPFNGNLPDNVAADVVAAVSKLEPDEYARLMQVGQLSGLCEYEKPTAKMRGDVALDYRLDEKGLAKVVPSQDVLKNTVKFFETNVAANGRPLSCYDLEPTELGLNVKTALVQSFKEAFAGPRGHREPAADDNKVAAR
jgi:hypothetical protein